MMGARKCRCTRRIAELRARSHGHRQRLQIVHVDRVRRRVHTLKTAPLDSGPDAAPAFLLFRDGPPPQKYSSSSFSAAAVVEFTTIRSPGPQHPRSRSPSAVRRVASSTMHVQLSGSTQCDANTTGAPPLLRSSGRTRCPVSDGCPALFRQPRPCVGGRRAVEARDREAEAGAVPFRVASEGCGTGTVPRG